MATGQVAQFTVQSTIIIYYHYSTVKKMCFVFL